MIDWKRVQVLKNEVGSEDFGEIVDLFLEEVESAIAELCALEDRTSLGENLHFLKSSAMSVGFSSFSDLCQAGEEAAEKGEADQINLKELSDIYQVSKKTFLDELPQFLAA